VSVASPGNVAGAVAVGGGAAGDPSVESFYHLATADVGARACRGLACFVARHLDPAAWEQASSDDPRVYCLGRCYAAPARGSGSSRPQCRVDAREAVVLARLARSPARSLGEYRRSGGYGALQQALARPREEVLRWVEAAGLRGRGGAAFPTGRQWRSAFERTSPQKYVVANGDEGDPGAYIDRLIMEDDPHALIEAMAIAGYVVGATEGWIYVRCEYPAARSALAVAVAEGLATGVLGERVLGSDFRFQVRLHVGRGSYVCGEETALLESIEGRRPMAKARPPYATESGLFGKPTVINNVETLVNVPWVVVHGPDAYHALGFSGSRGTKVVSLNSLFNRPGLYEVEFGVPVRHIVEDLGGGLRGGTVGGVIIGGPLAGVLPPHLLDTPFGFEELRAVGAAVGHGGVVAFDEHTSIPELVHHVFSVGAYESCGKCVPCRLGSRRIERILQGICAGAPAAAGAKSEWAEIVSALKLASLCGMGTGLAEFAESIQRHYGRELESCFA
jgi:NADH:ubiquinone oxidoreductase subunit F (NADH-binding)